MGCLSLASAQEIASRARQFEEKGQTGAARAMLMAALKDSPNDAVLLTIAAEFLDRHGDPSTREILARLVTILERNSSAERSKFAKRLVVLDMLAGDTAAAQKHMAVYKAAGGSAGEVPVPKSELGADFQTVEIPGPIRSFSRMAALSPDLPSEDVLPALARNVVTNGYQAANSNEGLEQTEYLKLVVRYLSQARELAKIAGEGKKIRVEQCESPVTADLLRALGYRMRGGCGAEVVLETVNASRAFLTIDSGFPLAELENALRANRLFEYPFEPTKVPVLYGPEYWLGAREKQSGEFIDQYIADPQLCRLYLGMTKLDRELAGKLKAGIPVLKLKAFSHVLDFFGGMYTIKDGKAIVPGGAKSEAAWAELTGAPVTDAPAFFDKLTSRDDGWMASYFDSLSRISGPVQDYLTQPERLKRFYAGLRGKVTSPGPARPVFRANTDLLLLTSRLRVGPDGKPHIPGNVEVWKQLFIKHPHGKYDGRLTRAASGWKEADDVLEALFGLCRKAVENEPLKIFMAVSDMDRRRSKPLDPATVDRLAREYRFHSSQYSILNETGSLSDATIIGYLDTIAAITAIRDQGVRSDAAGMMQGLVGIWQAFVRQRAIAEADADASLSAVVTAFVKAKGSREIFEAGWSGVQALLKAAKTPANANPQDRLIDLLAGAVNPEDADSHTQMVQDTIRVLEAQRVVSLKALGDLAAHLDELGKGGKLDPGIVTRVSARLSELQLPRAGLSGVEKNAMLFGYWSERHIEFQRKLNLRAMVERAGGDAAKLGDVKAALAPLLRDSVVGLLYAHYAPPGAQILFTNPVFVRSHDFLGLQGAQQTWKQTEVVGAGWPANAGGRLVGSLAGLSYALAEAEQNFLVPSREQALIWGDLVPQMVQSAKIPRFWQVTPAQVQFVSLHLRMSEAMLGEAAINPAVRTRFVDILSNYAPPARARMVGDWLAEGKVRKALENVTPSEFYSVAMAAYGQQAENGDPLALEIRRLMRALPQEANYAAISRAFGSPKPTLTNSYSPELTQVRTFPTLMGYSSRIMAESWESNLLYFASVADSSYMTPSQMNLAVPEWTKFTVERIFATHLEDWPALLRSMRKVGDEVRTKANNATRAAGGTE
jgi:hypothetical protein